MTISYRRGRAKDEDGSGTTVATAYSSNNLGDLGWLGIGWLDPAGTTDVSSVIDSAGNTWSTTPVGKVRNATEQYSARIYYVPTGIKAYGSNTVTVTLNATATFKRLILMEYGSSNGPWTSDPLDVSVGGTGSGTALSSGNMTPATADELIVGFGANDGGTLAVTPPYILRQPPGGGSSTCAVERILVGGAGIAVAAQATASATGQWLMVGAAFKDVTGAAPPPPLEPPVAATTPTIRFTRQSTPSSGRARALKAGGR